MSPCLLKPSIVLSLTLYHVIHSQNIECINYHQTLPTPTFALDTLYSSSRNTVYWIGHNDYVDSWVYQWDLTVHDSWFTAFARDPSLQQTFFSYSNGAVLINDTIYCVGYYLGNVADSTAPNTMIYKLDISAKTWTTDFMQPPLKAYAGCLSTNSSHLFLIDGKNNHEIQRSVYLQIYDINMNIWTQQTLDINGGITSKGYSDQSCYLIDNELYIFGGLFPDGDTPGRQKDIYKYNILEQQLINIGQLPKGQAYGVAVYHKHLIYLIGDDTKINVFNIETESLLNEYLTLTDNQIIMNSASLVLNGVLYVFGGRERTTNIVLDKVQICNISHFVSKLSINPTFNPTITSVTFEEKTNKETSNDYDMILGLSLGGFSCLLAVIIMDIVYRRKLTMQTNDTVMKMEMDMFTDDGGTGTLQHQKSSDGNVDIERDCNARTRGGVLNDIIEMDCNERTRGSVLNDIDPAKDDEVVADDEGFVTSGQKQMEGGETIDGNANDLDDNVTQPK